jgi:hypothetical protein
VNQKEAIEAAKAFPWAKWVAQDDNGSWWAYANEPMSHGAAWHAGGKNIELLSAIGPKIEIHR